MIQEEYSNRYEIIKYEDKLVAVENIPKVRIKVFKLYGYKKWIECLAAYWQFFAVTIAFATLFLFIVMLFYPDIASYEYLSNESDHTIEENVTAAALPETDLKYEEESDTLNECSVTVIDESMVGVEIDGSIDVAYSLSQLIGGSEEVKIIILHSHTSEYVSESLSVLSVGEVLTQILNSAGIKSYHCKTEHDADGTLGAYDRMKATLTELKKEFPEVVLIIDIHDSDTGKPLSLTVGTGFEYGWKQNLDLAVAVSSNASDIERVVRLLPAELGQNTGVLSLNIGICGNDYSDEYTRSVISSIANALIAICNNNTPSDSSDGVLLFK